jgi:transcriptional regulator with XRE-family HTH domain
MIASKGGLYMNFSERIVFCRKKAMLSQEELAGKLGVSRQAVSKWETGESIPDMNNLAALAEIFGVSLDWLIKGEEEKCEERPNDKPPFEERLPKFLGNMVKRFGWLAGVRMAIAGVMFIFIGTFTCTGVNAMYSGVGAFQDPFFQDVVQNNPVTTMSYFIMGLGAVIAVAGIVLAVILKKKSKE